MTKFTMARVALVMLLGVAVTVESAGMNHNTNNWFTKSMDYLHYEECSSQEKSDISAEFYGCLNSKSDSGKGGAAGDYTKYFKDYSGYMGGMSGGSLNPSVPDFINQYNPQNDNSASNGFQGDKKKVDKDTWPFKTCDELQNILRCMPKMEATECLTEREKNFFSTLKYFFQTQSGYICANKERISEAFEKSTCSYMKNRQDVQQQCFSINAQRLSYDWNVNFDDGVMCDLLKNLMTCEESYYAKCEEQIRAYVRHSWILPIQVTPCNSTLFEPLMDALPNNRRKRSVFNNQYGFKTVDGNGNSYSKYMTPVNADQADDTVANQKVNDLGEMFVGIMGQMQKSGSSMVREKRSIDDFMGSFSPMGKSSKNKKAKKDKKESTSADDDDDKESGFNPMGYVDYNSKMNQDWASKFNSFGGASDKSKKSPKSSKDSVNLKSKSLDKKESTSADDDDDKESGFSPMNYVDYNSKMNQDWASKFNSFGGASEKSKKSPKTKDSKDPKSKDKKISEVEDDKSSNPIEKNKKINFDFASKFSPFRMKRSLFGGLPGMKEDEEFSGKFNPNPFSGGANDDADDKDDDSGVMSPMKKNKKMNFDFANKFSPFGRRKRSFFDGLPGAKLDKDLNNKFNPNPFTKKKATEDDTAEDDDDSSVMNQAEKQKGINNKFSEKFGPSMVRSKRSADPYDRVLKLRNLIFDNQ